MNRGFTLLLVEDDENGIVLYKHAFAKSEEKTLVPIRLEVARDGEEAIRYLKGEGQFSNREKHPFPDIIISDLKMPRLSGLDVLAWLKEHEEYHRIPKIVVSASCVESDVDQAYRLGANTFFQKPPELDDFRDLVHYMVCYWARTQRPVVRHSGSQALAAP
jgi:CheY-like chemotaxis protein